MKDIKEIKEIENEDEHDNSLASKGNKLDEKLITEEEKNKQMDANDDEQKIEIKNDGQNTTIDNVNIISHKLKNLDVSASDLDEILLENFNDKDGRLK
jgi:hypothetical protein